MTPVDTVFELWGDQKWQAEEFEGRVEVPEERLGSGDCSLIISDVQIGDEGRYESFMVVDGVRSKKTRVFIQSVRLFVLGQSGFRWLLFSPPVSFSQVIPSFDSSFLSVFSLFDELMSSRHLPSYVFCFLSDLSDLKLNILFSVPVLSVSF